LREALGAAGRVVVFDGVGWMGPKVSSFFEIVSERAPVWICTRSERPRDIGHFWPVLARFAGVEVHPFSPSETQALVEAAAQTGGMPPRAQEDGVRDGRGFWLQRSAVRGGGVAGVACAAADVICEADGVLDKCPTKHHRLLSDAEGAEGIGRGYRAAVGADAENLLKMRRAIILSVVLAAGAVALVFAYLEMSKERKLEAAREKPVAAKSRASFGTNGEAVVTLDEETQKRIALKVQPVAPGTITPELKGYGRVLDPAPLAALSAELAAAEAALAASQKEFDRLRVLSEQQNASDRAL